MTTRIILWYLLSFSSKEVVGSIDKQVESINLKEDFFVDLVNILRGKHILMIGDSLMRYHYLSIAYLLRHHHPVSQSMNPNLVEENTWTSFPLFLSGSNHLLDPFERCDCYRNDGSQISHITENRYFSDSLYSIDITYFQFLGFTCHGRWWPGTAEEEGDLSVRSIHLPDRWSMSLEQTLTEFNKDRQLPATILILNVGFWHQANGNTEATYMNESLVEAATKNFKHVIWKTTNHYIPTNDQVLSPAIHTIDQYWCSRPSVHCLNLSWTKDLLPDDYWNYVHFRAKVYYRITAQLVKLLQSIEK